MIKIVRGGLLIDGTGQAPLEDAVVVIEDDNIKTVGSAENVKYPEGAIEIDASDKTIMPGFVDAHVHLALGGLGDPFWKRMTEDPESSCFYAAGNAQRALAKGVTTLQDCGGLGLVTLKLREAIKEKLLVGPKLLVAGSAITTTSGHLYFTGIRADNADELRKSIRYLVEKGVDFIKIMATGGGMTPVANRRRAQYSLAELTAAVDDAHRLRKRVIVHVNGTEGIRNAVKAGVDVLAHCNWMGEEENTVEYDESIVKLAVGRRIYLDIAPISGVTTPQITGPLSESELEKSSRWHMGLQMKSLGVRMYLASDNIGKDVGRFPADLKWLVENTEINPIEAITMATRVPAEAMGLGNSVGTIEPGKSGDMIVVDGNPVHDAAAFEKVDMVLLNGELVAIKGRISVLES